MAARLSTAKRQRNIDVEEVRTDRPPKTGSCSAERDELRTLADACVPAHARLPEKPPRATAKKTTYDFFRKMSNPSVPLVIVPLISSNEFRNDPTKTNDAYTFGDVYMLIRITTPDAEAVLLGRMSPVA